MKDLSFLFIFSFLILLSCKRPLVKNEYYENGEIRIKYIFFNKNDTTSFKVVEYYPNGNIFLTTQFIKGKRTGEYIEYYLNGNPHIEQSYENGILKGISKEYTKNGEIKEETFFINGVPVVLKRYFENNKLHLTKMVPYIIDKDTILHKIGIVIYNSMNNIINNASFFYNIIGPDTIKKENRAEYLIEFINKRNDFNFELYIGDLTPELTLSDTVFSSVTKKDTIIYSFIPKDVGKHLITGIVFLKNDTVTLKFPFYKEYFVSDK